MGDGLDLSRGRRSRRRTRRRLAVLGAVLVLAAGVWGLRGRLGPVWAVQSGLPGWVDARQAEHFVPDYTDRLRALRRRSKSERTSRTSASTRCFSCRSLSFSFSVMMVSPSAPQRARR